MTTSVLTLDEQASEVGKNRLRAAVVVGAAGLALTLVIAALWDARRPRRRHSRTRALRLKKPATEPHGTGAAGSEPTEPQHAHEADATPEAGTVTEGEEAPEEETETEADSRLRDRLRADGDGVDARCRVDSTATIRPTGPWRRRSAP